MKEITVRLDDETVRRIEAEAEFCGLKRAEFMREHLKRHFSRLPYGGMPLKASEEFFQELADVMGVMKAMKLSLEGPYRAVAERSSRKIFEMIDTYNF